MTKDEAKTVCVQPAQDLRSFPEAADGRPMPPMGDELMTAGLNCEDARFVAIQLAQNGLTLVSMTQNTTTPDLIKRMERIVRSEYAHRDHLILDCDLGQITFGDVRDLCDAAEAERDALKAENERKDAEIARLMRHIAQTCRRCRGTGYAGGSGGTGNMQVSHWRCDHGMTAALRAHEQGEG